MVLSVPTQLNVKSILPLLLLSLHEALDTFLKQHSKKLLPNDLFDSQIETDFSYLMFIASMRSLYLHFNKGLLMAMIKLEWIEMLNTNTN